MELFEKDEEQSLLRIRFWLVVVAGGAASTFGIVANALLTRLFLTRPAFRHSPFFFLGFVALFDTLLDSVYILLLIPPVLFEQLQLVHLYLSWLYHFKWLYLLGQIFKLSSVLCLIIASFERYLITSHWTFSGFEERTRWLLLTVVLFISIGIRFTTSVDVVILFNEQSIVPFRRYSPAQITHRQWLPNFFNLLTVIVPFGTLVFFNGGIVLMLRRQNVQQLRLLITELTMGYDYMKVRRRNIRAATNTLLLIISIFLISNLLSLFLSVFAFLNPGFLQKNYPHQYRISSDCSSLLTVVGNALRFPAHFISNGEVREHFKLMCFPPKRKVPFVMRNDCETSKNVGVFGLRRQSERLENQWFSALLTTRQSTRTGEKSLLTLEERRSRKRHYTIAGGQRRKQGVFRANENKSASVSDELEAYVRGEGERQQQPQQRHAFCAMCDGRPTKAEEEEGGGAQSTQKRHSMEEECREELITGGEETGEDDERTMEDEEEEEERQQTDDGAEDGQRQQSLPLLDLVELRFDPTEFSSIQQRV